jgi:hypothetical protein
VYSFVPYNFCHANNKHKIGIECVAEEGKEREEADRREKEEVTNTEIKIKQTTSLLLV